MDTHSNQEHVPAHAQPVICPPCRPVAQEVVPAMINAVMTHLQATAVLQSRQGGQPLTEEQSRAKSLLMAGEHI